MRESVIYQQIEAEAEARGETRGKEEKAQEITLSLLKTGMKVQQVAQVTGLPLERVLQLQGDN